MAVQSSITNETREAMIRDRRTGLTYAEIGARYGCSKSTVANVLNGRPTRARATSDYKSKKRTRTELPPAEDLAELIRQGWTTARLAQKFGCSRGVMQTRLWLSGVFDTVRAERKTQAVEAELVEQLGGSVEWMEKGLCARIPHPDWWFPGPGQSHKMAANICGQCPVRTMCLEYALENKERYGVWGGLSEAQRRTIERRNSGTKPSFVVGDPIGTCAMPECENPIYLTRHGRNQRVCSRSCAARLGALRRRERAQLEIAS